jgi:hypothetical protein
MDQELAHRLITEVLECTTYAGCPMEWKKVKKKNRIFSKMSISDTWSQKVFRIWNQWILSACPPPCSGRPGACGKVTKYPSYISLQATTLNCHYTKPLICDNMPALKPYVLWLTYNNTTHREHSDKLKAISKSPTDLEWSFHLKPQDTIKIFPCVFINSSPTESQHPLLFCGQYHVRGRTLWGLKLSH